MSSARRGRPPLSLSESSTGVHVKLPDGMYDRAFQLASRDRISIPELIRRALARDLEIQNMQRSKELAS